MTKRSKILFFVCMLLQFALWGCDNDSTLTNQYQSLPAKGWDSQNSLSFTVDSIRQTGNYNLTVYVRTTRNIQFQSISVVVEQHFKNPLHDSRDTIEVKLADEMGNLEGKGLYLYTAEAFAPHRMHLCKGQHGIIQLSHVMRRNHLTGIKDVGIRIARQ